ncbi:MAG TPA: PIN domain-containing protein [Phycisphaerae bacterium]|nr:PIN domain-containing protein [Phycisphaerae bacterium]
MGLILDSTIFIRAERQGETVRQMLAYVSHILAEDQEIGVSVITLMELAHGVVRADSRERQEPRVRFVADVESAVPIYPVTHSIAIRAGFVDGRLTSKGIRVALSDLLIGATALELGYAVATSNQRHFNMIPDLKVFVL